MKNFDRKVFFVYGGTDTKTREEIRSITENEKNAWAWFFERRNFILDER